MRNVIISLAAVTALTYAPSLRNDFQAHDDTLLITENPTAQGLSIKNIATAFTTFDPELYIPLTLLTYQVEYSLFGLQPFVFHLTNLLLHIGSSILVMLIALRLAQDRSRYPELIAISTGVLFALHPLNTEAVAWAAARKDILSSFFCFASLWAYLQNDTGKKWYRWAIALFALGLLSKVSIVVLPVLLLLVEEMRGRRAGIVKRTAPFFGLSLLFGIVAMLGKQLQISKLTLFDQALLWCKSVAFYIWKFLWPSGLNIVYDQYTPITLLRAEFYLAVLFIVLVLTLCAMMWKKHKIFSACVLWFLVCLTPSIATFWKNGIVYYASDRYAYIAIASLCFLSASAVAPYLHRYKVIGKVIVLALVLLTMKQSLTWKDTVATYERAVAYNLRPILPLNNLGTYYFQQDDLEAAKAHYLKALSYEQRIPETLINMGLLHRKLFESQEAMLWFQRSIHLLPTNRTLLENDLNGYYFLGGYYEQFGQVEKALEMFETAVLLAPNYPTPQIYLGIMYQKHRRLEQAKATLATAIELDSKSLDARYRLAAVQAELGDFDDAIVNLEYVIKKDADYEEAARHLQKLRGM